MDLGVECSEPIWRSYHLSSQGDTLVELQAYAFVTEIDQDGLELATYDLEEAPTDVREAGLRCLSAHFFTAQEEGRVSLI